MDALKITALCARHAYLLSLNPVFWTMRVTGAMHRECEAVQVYDVIKQIASLLSITRVIKVIAFFVLL